MGHVQKFCASNEAIVRQSPNGFNSLALADELHLSVS
jgi:hypothetical protein